MDEVQCIVYRIHAANDIFENGQVAADVLDMNNYYMGRLIEPSLTMLVDQIIGYARDHKVMEISNQPGAKYEPALGATKVPIDIDKFLIFIAKYHERINNADPAKGRTYFFNPPTPELNRA